MKIDLDYLKTTLMQLMAIPSPVGMTGDIIKFIASELQQFGVKSELTRRGSLKAIVEGSEPHLKRALSAHVDTLGAMVRELKPNGRLKIVPLGSWSARVAEECRATIHIESGEPYRGTILPLKTSGHAFGKEIDNQDVSWDNLEVRVDAKVSSKEELENLGIQIGDTLSIDPQSEIMDNGYIVSRYLDDLGGVACLLTAVKMMHDQYITIANNTLLLFTNTEEEGTGASMIFPDSIEELISVDIAIVAEGQESKEDKISVVFKDHSGPYDPHLTRKLEKLCKDNHIDYCRDIFKFYFSDCAAAITAGNDLRHALIGFGTDASHAFERTHIESLENTIKLILAYLTSD